MSGGALAQLVSRGEQDKHISGSPNTTYFNTKFKRHTNFSLFTKQMTLQTQPRPGGTSTIKINKLGDLLAYTNLVTKLNGEVQLLDDWTQVVESAELYIGGRLIDKQDSEFCESIAIDLFASSYSKSFQASLHGGLGSQSFFYPFRFFFCELWQTALPLVALQYHDIEIKINWSKNLNINRTYHVNASFILLDEEERKYVAFNEHNILIFQVQKNIPSNKTIHELVFNHPVKFIASSNASSTNNLVSRTNEVKLQVNGTDVEEFKTGVPYFTAIPSYYHTDYAGSNSENLFLHSFGLSANKYQPTGTLNFSRIDSCTLHCTQPIDRTIYSVNYNILRIKDGMSGVHYAD
jgi:hypothetical protein